MRYSVSFQFFWKLPCLMCWLLRWNTRWLTDQERNVATFKGVISTYIIAQRFVHLFRNLVVFRGKILLSRYFHPWLCYETRNNENIVTFATFLYSWSALFISDLTISVVLFCGQLNRAICWLVFCFILSWKFD